MSAQLLEHRAPPHRRDHVGAFRRRDPAAYELELCKHYSSLIEERHERHIAEIQQDVRAFTITARPMTDRLQVEPGGAALKILRRYLDADGVAFEISVSVHPADRFLVSKRLRR